MKAVDKLELVKNLAGTKSLKQINDCVFIDGASRDEYIEAIFVEIVEIAFMIN